MELEFDGQNTAKDKTADGKSCRTMHRGSLEYFLEYKAT